LQPLRRERERYLYGALGDFPEMGP
jgi:hypothetical protein